MSQQSCVISTDQRKAAHYGARTTKQDIWLDKSGIKIVVWDKYGKNRKGTLVVSIGGLRWYSFKGKKPASCYKWNKF